MKRSVLQKLILAWLIAWLPLAGAFAATMPVFAWAAASNVVTMEANDDSAMSAMPCHQAKQSTGDSTCTHCVLCHIAGTTLLPALPVVTASTQHDRSEAAVVVSFTSFVPALPQRPPSFSRA